MEKKGTPASPATARARELPHLIQVARLLVAYCGAGEREKRRFERVRFRLREQLRRRPNRPCRLGGEVHLNPPPLFHRGEQAAAGVEQGFLPRFQFPGLPENVSAGQGGMAAEIDLDGRCEPAQFIASVFTLLQKGRLG